jgi:hypothetical protein
MAEGAAESGLYTLKDGQSFNSDQVLIVLGIISFMASSAVRGHVPCVLAVQD